MARRDDLIVVENKWWCSVVVVVRWAVEVRHDGVACGMIVMVPQKIRVGVGGESVLCGAVVFEHSEAVF